MDIVKDRNVEIRILGHSLLFLKLIKTRSVFQLISFSNEIGLDLLLLETKLSESDSCIFVNIE